jgi:hypothetical protein
LHTGTTAFGSEETFPNRPATVYFVTRTGHLLKAMVIMAEAKAP